MKKITFISILLFCAAILPAQWIQIPSGTTKNLHDVHFPSDSVGYCVGDSGIVLKTVNGGNSWQTVYSDPAKSFQSVFFTDNSTGYAAGGNIYKTTNGGQSWSAVLIDSNNLSSEVYFLNASLGFAGAHNQVYKTTNAGLTWSVVINSSTGAFNSIHFPSNQVGYFIGGQGLHDHLFKTTDGGQTFTQITNGFQSIKESVHFINDTTGFICGWYGGMVIKTTDGGMTWQHMDTVNFPQCWDVHFNSLSQGYYIAHTHPTSIIVSTNNGGNSWTTELVAPAKLMEFFFIKTHLAIAVGYKGLIYKMHLNQAAIKEDQTEKQVHIYPNPANGFMTIQLPKSVHPVNMQLFDLHGKPVREFLPHQDVLDIKGLSPGCYFLKINTGQGFLVKKILLE